MHYQVDGGPEVRTAHCLELCAMEAHVLSTAQPQWRPLRAGCDGRRKLHTSSMNEHSHLLFFGFLIARWQADELFLLFASLSLAGRHCQGLGIQGFNWIKWGYQKATRRRIWC